MPTDFSNSSSAIEFAEDVAIVTGAGGGLGRSHALELARRGARVVVNDVDVAGADAVVAEIGEAGGIAIASHDSVADETGSAALVAKALEEFGSIHILVNNAGIMRNGLIEDLSTEQFESVVAVNLAGHFYPSRAVWAEMRDAGYGRIVMTCSAGAMFAMQGESNYAASKGGVYGLTKALAVEGREDGILVNALLPMASTSMAAGDPVPGHAERYPGWVREGLSGRSTTAAVSPMVALLAARDWAYSGEAYSVGFGRYARVFVAETEGWVAGDPALVSAEEIRERLEQVRTTDRGFAIPADIYEEIEFIGRTAGVAPPAPG
jgi:NAD(P)-dependent dehydrogenase (short-subunit alcohol dehydrogenase family)